MRETTVFFPVLIPRSFSKLSQYVFALCFVLFLGRNHYWCAIPFHTSAPNSRPICGHRYSSWQVSYVSSFYFFIFSPFVKLLLAHFFLSCFHFLFSYYTKRCCQVKILEWWVVLWASWVSHITIIWFGELGRIGIPAKFLHLFSFCFTNHISLPLLMIIRLVRTFPFLLTLFLDSDKCQQ